MLIDSHAHLDSAEFAGDLGAVIARAHAAGVEGMLTVSTRVDQFEKLRAIAEENEGIWCSEGAHPHEAQDHADLDPQRLAVLANHPKVVAIG